MQQQEGRGNFQGKAADLNAKLEQVIQDFVTRWENREPSGVQKFDLSTGPALEITRAIADAHAEGSFPIELDKVPEVGTHVDEEGEIWTNRGPSLHHIIRDLILSEGKRMYEDQKRAAEAEMLATTLVEGRGTHEIGPGYTIERGSLRELIGPDGSFQGWVYPEQYDAAVRRMTRDEERWQAYVEKHGQPDFSDQEPSSIQKHRLMEQVQPAWRRVVKRLLGV